MKRLPRLLVAAVAVSTTIAPSIYWFDPYHLGDPTWAPHARAHLIWMWILVTAGASVASAIALFDWERSADARRFAAGFPILVWGACLLEAFLVSPALGVTVPLTHWRMKVVADVEANLFGIAAPFLLALVGLALDRRARLAR